MFLVLSKLHTSKLRRDGKLEISVCSASEIVQAADALGVPLRDVMVYAEKPTDRVVVVIQARKGSPVYSLREEAGDNAQA